MDIKKYCTRKCMMNIIILCAILLSISLASSVYFRPYPTHMIVRQVNCISCHTEQINDLMNGTHILTMNAAQDRFFYDYVDIYGNESEPYKTIEGPCYSCHITYANYHLFGLTDPYAYVIGNRAYTIGNSAHTVDIIDAQYGTIIEWPVGNRAVEYFGGNTAVTVELELLSTMPSNSAVDSIVKFSLTNYSGQQNGSTSCDCEQTLYEGDTHVLKVENISDDYFKIILILDGSWNNATMNLRIYGTDQGDKSYFITANNNHPFIYELPFSDTGAYYFKTNGTYKAVRLDYVFGEWINYTINNITTSEIVRTNSTNGWINANTCSSQDALCHINQRATYMGLNDGLDPDESFYTHRMQSVTTIQCKLCHLKDRLMIENNYGQ